MTSSLLASVAVCLLALVQSASADVKNYRSGLKRGYGTAYSGEGGPSQTMACLPPHDRRQRVLGAAGGADCGPRIAAHHLCCHPSSVLQSAAGFNGG